MRARRHLALALILVLYVGSFFLPVFDNTGIEVNHMNPTPRGMVYGWQAFLFGALMMGIGLVINLLFLAGVICLATGRPRGACVLGTLAAGGGLHYLLYLTDPRTIFRQTYLIGYDCWLASLVVLAVCGALVVREGQAVAKASPVDEL